MASGNRNRAAGDRFEYRVRDTFRARGWFVVRAAGSLGPVDLVALKRGQPAVLLSCKTSGRIGPAERDTLVAVARVAGGEPLVAYREKRGWVGLDRVTGSGVRESVATWHMPTEDRNHRLVRPIPYPPEDPGA